LTHSLDNLFLPKNIAVIGATTRKKWGWSSGNSWIAGSLAMGLQGAIFPVHPTADTIMGYKVYASVLDIPHEIDLAIFTIPLAGVIEVLKQCIQKQVKFVHLLTAGFSETGREEFKGVEEEIVQVARSGGIRLIGPNCMGLYCPEGGLAWNTSFPQTPGSVGLFSQSGQLASEIIMSIKSLKPRFSKAVSFGNASDLKAHEFLSYYAADEKTEVIAGYVEGLRDGREFFEAARSITPKKPLVVWKGGQTEGGSRATQSHTAAIAGSQTIWDAMCRQTGIISVSSLEEMVNTVQALQMMPLPSGRRVVVLGGAGGGSVTMTDFAEKEGLSVPRLADKTIEQLEAFIPVQGSSSKNPLDIMMALFDKKNFYRVIELLREDPNTDALIFNLDPGWIYRGLGRTEMIRFIGYVVEAVKMLQKPLFISLEHRESPQLAFIREEIRDLFNQADVATFPDFSMTARIINNLKKYNDFLQAL
jgi:acyl-CoA synthetase (NDP forming)